MAQLGDLVRAKALPSVRKTRWPARGVSFPASCRCLSRVGHNRAVRACSIGSSWLHVRATMSQKSSLTQSSHSVRQALTAYKYVVDGDIAELL
jgi:hypothetical protein